MEVPKRKPKTQTERGMGEQLANLELRAELDPYLENNPVARLGYDVLMRGYVPGEGPSGKMYSLVGDNKDMYDLYGFFQPKGDPSKDPYIKSLVEDLKKQGVEFDPDAGSFVYYQQTDRDNYKTGGLETLMHELAHVGFKFMVDQGLPITKETELEKYINSLEEPLVDLMEARTRRRFDRPMDDDMFEAKDKTFISKKFDRGTGPLDERQGQDYRLERNKLPDLLSRFDVAANTAMQQRGMPPQAVRRPVKAPEPKEPTFAEKLAGLFGG